MQRNLLYGPFSAANLQRNCIKIRNIGKYSQIADAAFNRKVKVANAATFKIKKYKV
jgi:hypothetical protein